MDEASDKSNAKRSSEKHRNRKTRLRTPRPYAWWEQGHVSVAGIADGERKLLFPMIASATRTVLGHDFNSVLVTKDKEEQIAGLVKEAVDDAGLKLIPLDMLRGRIEFWLKVNNPAKALWFGIADVGAAHVHVSQLVSPSTIAAINTEHADKLRGRRFDHYVLAVALCIICKNSIVANRRTRKEENGTNALRQCLTRFGISANGTLASQCFKVLDNAGLICCTEREFVIGKRCRRWIPVGQSWSIPFMTNLLDSDLSEQQHASRDAYRASLKSPNENGRGCPYRIRSQPIPDTQTTTTQTTNYQSTTGTNQQVQQPAISEGWSWISQAVLEQAAKEQAQYILDHEDMEDQIPDPEMADIFAMDFDDDADDEDDLSPAEEGQAGNSPIEAEASRWLDVSAAIMASGPYTIITDPEVRRRVMAGPPILIPF